MTAFWRIERDGPVSRFRLDSDDGRQTLSPGLLEELAAGAAAESGRGSALITVESLREGLFAAGADLTRIRELSGPEAHSYARRGQEAIFSLARIPAAIVAEIDGACFGGALDLAMGCDIRLAPLAQPSAIPAPASDSSRAGEERFSRPFCSAPRRRGGSFAEGEVFDAASALRLGVVDEVIPEVSWHARLARNRSACAPGDLSG